MAREPALIHHAPRSPDATVQGAGERFDHRQILGAADPRPDADDCLCLFKVGDLCRYFFSCARRVALYDL